VKRRVSNRLVDERPPAFPSEHGIGKGRHVERIALITGGAGGLGYSTARHLAEDGLKIVLTDINAEAAANSAKKLPGDGHLALGLDISDEQAVVDAFALIEQKTGPISVLAHFAGAQDGAGAAVGVLIGDMTAQSWKRVFDINAFGTFVCVREMIRWRRKSPVEHARIITVSSLAGQMGGYIAGAGYAASKGAVIAFTKNAARELAPLGITVNSISPGAIETPMYREAAKLSAGEAVPEGNSRNIPMGRVGQSDEVGAVAGFLASPAASYVTGQIIAVNGGSYM
jgi:3-oxoacyl-[acyl-carrier protein] reductase